MKAIRYCLLAVWCVGNLGAQVPGGISYFREIRPLIQRNCQGCHQPAMKSGSLDLTRYESFDAGGSKGPAFKAGQPQESVVLAYLQGTRQPRMPLGLPPLPDDQIELFRGWIAASAKDDTPAEARDTAAPDKPPIYHLPPVITALAYSPDGAQKQTGCSLPSSGPNTIPTP